MNERKPWTTRELAFLREHALQMPSHEIARLLQRTPAAVRSFARTHGVALGHKPQAAPEPLPASKRPSPQQLVELKRDPYALDRLLAARGASAHVMAIRYDVPLRRVYEARRAWSKQA